MTDNIHCTCNSHHLCHHRLPDRILTLIVTCKLNPLILYDVVKWHNITALVHGRQNHNNASPMLPGMHTVCRWLRKQWLLLHHLCCYDPLRFLCMYLIGCSRRDPIHEWSGSIQGHTITWFTEAVLNQRWLIQWSSLLGGTKSEDLVHTSRKSWYHMVRWLVGCFFGLHMTIGLRNTWQVSTADVALQPNCRYC